MSFASGYANRLIIDPGAVFSGTVNGGNAIGGSVVSTLELVSSANKGTLTGLGANYINFGQVTVDTNATWILAGTNSLVAGAALTNSGTLVVNHVLTDSGVLTTDSGVLVVGGGAGKAGTLTVNPGVTLGLSGTSATAADLVLGNATAAASGTVFVAGTGALIELEFPIIVGKSAANNGLLSIASGATVETPGTATTQFTLTIGQSATSTGTVATAGTLITNGQIAVGDSGTGVLSVSSGGTVGGDDGVFAGVNSGELRHADRQWRSADRGASGWRSVRRLGCRRLRFRHAGRRGRRHGDRDQVAWPGV